MKANFRLPVWARFVCGLAAVCVAMPHDLYLKPGASVVPPASQQRVAMHNGDSFPGSDGPPALERLRDSQVVSASGTEPLRNVRVDGKVGLADYVAPQGSFAVVTRTIPNFIELGVFSFERYLKHEELEWVVRWRAENNESLKSGREFYSKHAKALVNLSTDDFALAPIGHTAEIVLLENPAKRKPGDALRIRVLFRGKPMADQPIEASWAFGDAVKQQWVGRTNEQGELSVSLESAGLWKLHTIVMERRTDRKEADWESFWASVTFEFGEQR
ncbi:MAG: DUF4198 domain-containing protein [Bryobacterales bacterium]|nr:DUF4198 domain-containing protein [Bryobacterales bacterium]